MTNKELDRQVLGQMIDEAARKAANEAAEQTAIRVNAELRLEISQLEARLRRDINREVKETISESLGMTIPDHIAAHEAIRNIREEWQTIRQEVIRNTIKYMFVGIGIVVLVAYLFSSGKLEQVATIPPDATKQLVVQNQPRDKKDDPVTLDAPV